MSKKIASEFGKGLTYCIGLFLGHEGRIANYKDNKVFRDWPEMWFNGASDHLYELDATQVSEGKLREEIEGWVEKILHWGHGFSPPKPTEEDFKWSLEKAKEFLRRIDKTLLNTKTIKGQWQ